MYSKEQLKVIAAEKPSHYAVAEYSRWRRACVRLGLPTSHELVTPLKIRQRNNRNRRKAKAQADGRS